MQLFVEDTKPGYTTTVTDYPFTPGGAEFDQQSERKCYNGMYLYFTKDYMFMGKFYASFLCVFSRI